MVKRQTKIVLDTNVLYAGLYSSKGASFQVLKAISDGKVKPTMSVTLLFEYEDILRRNQEVLGLRDKDIDGILDYLCFASDHQKVYFLWRPCLSDPKDDHLLELAVAAKAQKIVTHNIKDFVLAKKFGIKIVTPKELLEEKL